VIPIGITRQGHWLTGNQAILKLTGDIKTPVEDQMTLLVNGDKTEDTWALLPHAGKHGSLPALDIIFPVLHGPYGEDGAVQGMLEMANIPYVGSGVMASAVGMDKTIAKQLFSQAGLRQTAYQVVLRKRWQRDPAAGLEHIEHTLRYPLFVKPANLGSSIGVSKVCNRHELVGAIDLACRYDRKVLVEQAVGNAREIEVSVLGNDDPIVSIPGEIVPGNEFYDYAAKYLDDNSDLLIPAPISDELAREVQEMALAAFQTADCAGLARVDFLLDNATQKVYLNEINTMPGFTRISMYPKLWEASGLPYPELVSRLIDLAIERHTDQMQNAVTRTV
jgi:D-alanine-D-alanine ligase